jgi:hypothetical protein
MPLLFATISPFFTHHVPCNHDHLFVRTFGLTFETDTTCRVPTKSLVIDGALARKMQRTHRGHRLRRSSYQSHIAEVEMRAYADRQKKTRRMKDKNTFSFEGAEIGYASAYNEAKQEKVLCPKLYLMAVSINWITPS